MSKCLYRAGKGGETRGETRTRESREDIRKKEKKCEITLLGRTSEIQYFYRHWILNILGLCLRPGILFFVCNFRDKFCVDPSTNLYFYIVTNYCNLIYYIVKLGGTLLSLNLCYNVCYSVLFSNQIYNVYTITGILPRALTLCPFLGPVTYAWEQLLEMVPVTGRDFYCREDLQVEVSP